MLGLHIVRGDNICVIGEIDEDVDQRLGKIYTHILRIGDPLYVGNSVCPHVTMSVDCMFHR